MDQQQQQQLLHVVLQRTAALQLLAPCLLGLLRAQQHRAV